MNDIELKLEDYITRADVNVAIVEGVMSEEEALKYVTDVAAHVWFQENMDDSSDDYSSDDYSSDDYSSDDYSSDDSGDEPEIPTNEIHYTATSQITQIDDSEFGANYLPGESTFDETTGKGILKFDGDVTYIGNDAFSGCSSLTSVTIPNSVTSIGYNAFEDCTNLTSITIPNSVTSIECSAFKDCTNLTSITIGNRVTSIGYNAFFMGDEESGESSYPGSLQTITVVDGQTYNYNGEEDFTITLTNGTNVILGMWRQEEPVGPASDEIWYTSSYHEIVTPYQTSALPEIDTNTYSDGKGVIKFKTDVTSIGNYAFRDCSSLTSVTIPNSVTSIGDDAFYGCSGLTSIEIPNSVTSIGSSAFYNCSGLTSVTIPNSVTSIEVLAFYGCSGLTSVTIPNSVTSIGDGAFAGCSGLTSVTIPNSVTSIGDDAFRDCTSLISVTIPNSVTSIGEYAFQNCTSLTSVTIPNSVTSIGNYAFFMGDEPSIEYPGSLQTITVVDGQTYIYNGEEQFTITLANGTNVTLEMWYQEEKEPEEPTEVEVTIEHEDGISETVTLFDDETYAEQGYEGCYYSSNTYDSNIETSEDYLVDNDYPADGDTIYDYCDDIAEDEPEDPEEDNWSGPSNINNSNYITNKGTITAGTPVVVSVNEEVAEYKFTPLETGEYTIYSTGDGDTYGAIYQGNTQIASNDDGDGNVDYNFSMNCNLTAGVTYSIRATMLDLPSGTFTLHVDFEGSNADSEEP